MWLFLPLLLWPLIEIALFVTLGGWLGLWPTLAWVVISAALGLWVIRRQGERAQIAMRQGIGALSDPLSPVAGGALKVAAGLLLILPGFLTDAFGLLLLLPPVRAALVAVLARRVVVVGGAAGATRPGDWRSRGRPDVIDGEFIDLDADALPRRQGPPGSSGWTRD